MAQTAVKVYGWAMSPFVARALLCLEEASVDYELVPMSREAGDNLRPDFLARNPFARCPSSRTATSPSSVRNPHPPISPLILQGKLEPSYQQAGIPRRVARDREACAAQAQAGAAGRGRLAGGGGDGGRVAGGWKAHQHHAPTGAIMVQCILTPLLGGVRDQAVVDENVAKLKKVLAVYEARLSASRYLAGESLTLADRSHFPMMRYFMDTESTRRWWRSSRM
ncbi:hypothetical protein ACQ4PT_068210 [Festuca glaucescens]